MLDVEKLLGSIKETFLPEAEKELGDLAHSFWVDAEAFVKDTKDDLVIWTDRLAKGEMSVKGFELAVRGRAAALRIKALTDAGIAQMKLERLKMALASAVVAAVRDVLRV